MSPNAGERVAGSQPMRTAVHITWHGAQTNFGDLTPHLTYGYELWATGQEQKKILTCLQLRAMLRHLLLLAVTAFSRHFLKLADFLLCFVYCLNQSPQSLWVNHKLITSVCILLLVERILAVISKVPYLWKDTIIQISSTTQLLNKC